MMWLPQQTLADWQESVEALIDVSPDHASLYLLELYPNAPLKEDMARAGWSLAPDDDAAAMYLWSLDRLDTRRLSSSTRSRTSRGRPRVSPQPEVLAGRRVAWVRMRRALDAGRRAVEERAREPRTTSPGSHAGELLAIERRELTAEGAARGRAFHGASAHRRRGHRAASAGAISADVWARFGSNLQPFVDEGCYAARVRGFG